MSKVELAGRPEPGYESMEQFSVSVEHVAEMLRTIDFQPGEDARQGEAVGRRDGASGPSGWGRGRVRGPNKQGLHWGVPWAQALLGRKRTRTWHWTGKRAARG